MKSPISINSDNNYIENPKETPKIPWIFIRGHEIREESGMTHLKGFSAVPS